MEQGIVWSFETKRLRVTLDITRDRYYRYDGDDDTGEVQAKLDSGEYVAFDSCVTIELKNADCSLAVDHLGSSVYGEDNYSEFWTAHRDADANNRNCSITRATCGGNVCIGHYFPDMVREAIREARIALPRNTR